MDRQIKKAKQHRDGGEERERGERENARERGLLQCDVLEHHTDMNQTKSFGNEYLETFTSSKSSRKQH